jgi:chaperone modulatory protein CbpM
MTDKKPDAHPAEMAGPEPVYSLDELCEACDVEAAWIVELIQHGVVEARGTTASEWRFSSVSVVRLAKAKRFDRDLGVNPAGIALAFDLLADIERLKAHLNVLMGGRSSLTKESDLYPK